MHTSVFRGTLFAQISRGCGGTPAERLYLATEHSCDGKVVTARIDDGAEVDFRVDEVQPYCVLVREEDLDRFRDEVPDMGVRPIRDGTLSLATGPNWSEIADSWLQHKRDLWALLKELGWY